MPFSTTQKFTSRIPWRAGITIETFGKSGGGMGVSLLDLSGNEPHGSRHVNGCFPG